MAAFVFVTAKADEEMTRGTSGTVEMRWPRARRRDGTEDAASAEAVAKRLRDECQRYEKGRFSTILTFVQG